MTTQSFTPAQLKHFDVYERVRSGGKFNMFNPRAQAAAGLNQTVFLFVIENYDALKAQYAKEHP